MESKNNSTRAANSGFTLIEIIVSTALFVVIVSALVGLYLQAIDLSNRADTTRTAAQNARDLSESLAKDVRNGTIDFGDEGAVESPCNGSPSSPTPQGEASLGVLTVDGAHNCLYLGDAASGGGNPPYDPNGKYLYLIRNTEPAQLLNSPNLSINSFKVYILPTSDPASGSNQEELVSIVGSVSAVSGSANNTVPQDTAVIPLDVTISIPDYGYSPH